MLSVTLFWSCKHLNLHIIGISKALPNIFDNYFQYACDIHSYDTGYASTKNFYKPCTRTNIGKQSVSAIVVDLWKDLPASLKKSLTLLLVKQKNFLLKPNYKKNYANDWLYLCL